MLIAEPHGHLVLPRSGGQVGDGDSAIFIVMAGYLQGGNFSCKNLTLYKKLL